MANAPLVVAMGFIGHYTFIELKSIGINDG